MSESKGTETKDSIKLTYSRDGDYTVTLKLENSLSSDAKSYHVLKIGEEVGIEDGLLEDMLTYTVEVVLFVEFT